MAFIVGRIAGMPFRDFLMKRIFGPLGMVDTDFYVPPEKRKRAAVVYRLNEAKNVLEPLPFKQYDTPPAYCGGGGGLISTADDYLKFARMMLNKRRARRHASRQRDDGRADVHQPPDTGAARAIPFLGAIPMWDGMGFGLGVSVIDAPEKLGFLGMGGVGSFGWPGAFGTWWQADPANDSDHDLSDPELDPARAWRDRQPCGRSAHGGRIALPMFQRLTYDALTK